MFYNLHDVGLFRGWVSSGFVKVRFSSLELRMGQETGFPGFFSGVHGFVCIADRRVGLHRIYRPMCVGPGLSYNDLHLVENYSFSLYLPVVVGEDP